ncbi:cysteine-tryptophan domain-containing zinc finger protein 3-like [Argentina anserina]|uniref:cysteine-tryptophan domain-containing zinc finger protein 3-like n=1 Tax=Argentina anserina TaxID=57926 RepID=UPI0021768E73|nr:cysteine-tryptophan domain-containing zinc finger protein 3-like [Potentilla anserina]
MEVNNNSTELEEGEASCYYKDDGEKFDPDTDLAYLEEKLEQVLGHFQKDFEGGAFAENLGAKYGGYGSFLPTYERSPSVLSTPKTLLGNCNTSRSPKSSMEGASQNLKASSKALPTVRPGTSSPSARFSHDSRVIGGISSQEDLCVPSTQVAERCSLKDEMSNRSGNSSDQRTLKFRIKMNSENSSRKNIAIYSGLGLSSPSSSFGNSPDGSGEMPPASEVNVDESPTNIVQVMTSFHVPGHDLMSPLHDSFICLTRKKKLHQLKIVPQSKGPQERSLSASTRGNGKLSKELNVEVAAKGEEQVEPKIENVKNDMKILIKKKSGIHCLGSKELLSSGYKSLQLSNSVGDFSDCAQGMHRTPKSGGTNENGVKGSLSIFGLAKPESKELISDHSFDKNEKQNTRCGSAEKFQKQSKDIFHKNGPVELIDGGNHKGYKFSASLDYSGAFKCKEELDQHPQNVGEETTYHGQGKKNVHGKKEKLSFKGNIKSNEKLVNEKQPGSLTNGSFGVEMGIVTEDELHGGYGVCLSSRKAHKLKLQKDSVRDNRRDSSGGTVLEQRDKMEAAKRPVDDFDVQCKSSKVKPSEKLSGRKVDNVLMPRGSIKDAFATCLPTFENGLASDTVPVVAAPIVLLEDWVCCDNCQKWRLLPFGRKDLLPEKWLCSMLDWLGPGMNQCDISEEETTKALNALYQQPSSESLTNLLTHASGTTSVVPSDHAQHLDRDSMYDRVKKRLGAKERHNTINGGGGVLISYLQEPVKCTSLNDVNQPPLESNSMKKSTDQRMSNLQNLGMDKNIAKQKEKQRSGGDAKRVRLIHKKDIDHHIYGTSKKPRREDMLHADTDRSSEIDLGRMGVTSSNGLLTHVLDHDRKYNDLSSEGTNVKLQFSVRKPAHQIQVSLDGGPSDVGVCSKGDNSMKKKRNREWQNNVETSVHSVNDGRVYNEEESSESGSWREKKARNLKNECKDSTTSNIDDKSDRKSRVTKIVVSGTKARPSVVMLEDRNIVKDQQPRKHSKRNASQRNLEGANALKRDNGSGHVSIAATSSSSKISGCHKFKGDIEEVKGSPVESVSSSPLRTSNSNRPTLAKQDGSVKDEPICGGFFLTSKSKRLRDGGGNGSFDRLGNTGTEKTSDNICPESHNFSTVGYHRGDSSGNDGQFLNDQHDLRCHYDDRENKNHPEDLSFQKRSSNGSSLPSKDNIRGSSSDLDRDKMKISDPVTEYSKKSQRYVSEIDRNHDVRNNLPEECSIETVTVKDEKNYEIKLDNVGQGSSGSALETQLQQKGYEVSDEKLGATEFPIKKGAPRQNMNHDFGCGQKQNKSNSGKPTSSSNSHSESKEGAEGVERKEGARYRGSQAIAWPEREAVFQGLPSFAVNGNVQKSSRQCGTATTKNGDNCNGGHLMPDHQGARDVVDSSPMISASGQIAIKILNEARSLRDKAEQSKKGGFHDVSTVAYFQAAQKFLQGASLLESCSYEKGKHEDMTPLQVYSSTAKLCEFCAHEYENFKEVASAALAYKCMEVAYMRVVYCKHSSITRDRHELQATLNMPHQGESPSSSASDIDNLTDQVMAEKAILSKGTGSHVARNRPKILRLLDFTQDVNFAMEASQKSQSAFSAACLALEDSHKNDCISSIRRVIEFSFQDVEEFVRLVELAMKAIGRSKFTGPRD